MFSPVPSTTTTNARERPLSLSQITRADATRNPLLLNSSCKPLSVTSNDKFPTSSFAICFSFWRLARAAQEKASRACTARLHRLEASDVRGLQALGAGGDFEFNGLPFVQRLVPLRLDGGEVYENVFAGLALDESESLAGVEPLYCSLFFHENSSSLVWAICLSYRLQP